MRDTNAHYPGFEADEGKIRDLVTKTRWTMLDGYWDRYVRQVHDNLRMIEGRHWEIWVAEQQRWVDVSEVLTENDRRFHQRPVINWIGYWHHQTVAKLSENPPVISFVPATADRADTKLAEIMDPIWKYLWQVCDMDIHVHDFVSMLVAAGSAIIKSTWDPDAGEAWEARADAPYVVLDEQGEPVLDPSGQPVQDIAPDVPHQMHDGEPVPMIEPVPGGGYREIGGPTRLPDGQISVKVLSPLAVRTSMDNVPFHRRRWFVEKSQLHIQDVYERYGVELDTEEGDSAEVDVAGGKWGATRTGTSGPMTQLYGENRKDDMVTVYEMWEQPREQAPEGRHVVCTEERLLSDGPNPYGTHYRPYERAHFLHVPSRPDFGKSPVEDLSPINRLYNRGWSQILTHRNKMTNPFYVVDRASGIEDITNEPGQVLFAFRRGQSAPVEAIAPPPLPDSVYHVQAMLKEEMKDYGSLRHGSEGDAPTRDASGELVKELRANDDRYLTSPTASIVSSLARMSENWQTLLKFGWPSSKTIEVAGEEQAATFHLVQREIFQGKVHAKGVVESMLPEGRQERQNRVDWWLQQQVIGPEQYFEAINHPHLGAVIAPGGVDKSMALTENAKMMQGQPPQLLFQHNDDVHIELHRKIIAGPEFRRLQPEVQNLFMMHFEEHMAQAQEKAQAQLEQAAAEAEMQAAIEGGSDDNGS